MWPRMRILRSVSSHVNLIWATQGRVVLCSKPFPQIKRWNGCGWGLSLHCFQDHRAALSYIERSLGSWFWCSLSLHYKNWRIKSQWRTQMPSASRDPLRKGEGEVASLPLEMEKSHLIHLKSAAVRWAIQFKEGCMGFFIQMEEPFNSWRTSGKSRVSGSPPHVLQGIFAGFHMRISRIMFMGLCEWQT